MVLSLGLSALVLGGTMIGCTATGGGGGIASASDRNAAVSARNATGNADKAMKALTRGNGVEAIGFAEAAVALAPRSGDYRLLLGQSYLQAGRFASARTAFTDALQLSPDNGKAALSLALTQVAAGDWQAARMTLDAHEATIPAVDRGLALALAGNPAGAVTLLTEVARSPQNSPKVRQNLALSLALSGQWDMARVVAAADMSPADVDKRMEEWAAFAQPAGASDQVATLLGVHPASDMGQPTALALNGAVPTARPVALAAAEVPTPVSAMETISAPVAEAVAVAAPAKIDPLWTKVAFGPRQEVVQSLPVRTIDAPMGAMKFAAVKPVVAKPFATSSFGAKTFGVKTGGTFFVQLGAFHDAGGARNGWGRAQRRFASLAGHVPNGASFSSRSGNFYRLSVGGFARADADAMCRRYRQAGGQCFVRAGAGDAMAQWLRPAKSNLQVASRG